MNQYFSTGTMVAHGWPRFFGHKGLQRREPKLPATVSAFMHGVGTNLGTGCWGEPLR
jgi:hypothetical protein